MLNREMLQGLQLNEDVITSILGAHEEAVAALRQEGAASLDALAQERDEWRTRSQAHETAALSAQEALSAYQAQVEQTQLQQARHAALCDALARFGANEQAIAMMADAAMLTEADWNGDKLADEGAFLCTMKSRYAGLFSVPQSIPTRRVNPPVTPGGALTPDDLRHMSAGDINSNWSAVKQALGR